MRKIKFNTITSFKLSTELFLKLESASQEAKITKGAIIRELLTNYLT
jgi:predicted DNA-binding protein